MSRKGRQGDRGISSNNEISACQGDVINELASVLREGLVDTFSSLG